MSRFIQDMNLGFEGQSENKCQLGPHSLGQGGDLVRPRQRKFIFKLTAQASIPVDMIGGHHRNDGVESPKTWEYSISYRSLISSLGESQGDLKVESL